MNIEREPTGTPWGTGPESGRIRHDEARNAVVRVVLALRDTESGPASRALSVFGEDCPLWDEGANRGSVPAALVERRATESGPLLRAATPCFDTVLARLLDLLSRPPSATGTRVVHDDLRPDDVLVDSAGRPEP